MGKMLLFTAKNLIFSLFVISLLFVGCTYLSAETAMQQAQTPKTMMAATAAPATAQAMSMTSPQVGPAIVEEEVAESCVCAKDLLSAMPSEVRDFLRSTLQEIDAEESNIAMAKSIEPAQTEMAEEKQAEEEEISPEDLREFINSLSPEERAEPEIAELIKELEAAQ